MGRKRAKHRLNLAPLQREEVFLWLMGLSDSLRRSAIEMGVQTREMRIPPIQGQMDYFNYGSKALKWAAELSVRGKLPEPDDVVEG